MQTILARNMKVIHSQTGSLVFPDHILIIRQVYAKLFGLFVNTEDILHDTDRVNKKIDCPSLVIKSPSMFVDKFILY